MSQAGRAALTVALTLSLAASTASARCDPSGRQSFIRGLESLNQGDLPAAARIFYQLVQVEPGCPEVRNNLAVVFAEQGRLEEAAQQLQQALQLDPAYQRAHLNLERIEALRRERQGQGPQVTPAPAASPPVAAQPTPAPAEIVQAESPPGAAMTPETKQSDAPPETKVVEAKPTPTKPADSNGVGTPPPSPTPEAHGAVACVIEPARNRVCVYQHAAEAMTAGECYSIASAEVRSWPRWLTASEVTPKRIRLLDETGQTRLEIVAEDTAVSGDALHLRRADWEALAAQVVPWHTGWIILQ